MTVTADSPPSVTGPLARFVEGLLDRPVRLPVDGVEVTPRESPEACWWVVGQMRVMGFEVAVSGLGEPVTGLGSDGPVFSSQWMG